MASTQSVHQVKRDGEGGKGGEKQKKERQAEGEVQREASAPKQRAGVLLMPSVLLTTSGLDEVRRPIHLEGNPGERGVH